MNPRLYQEGDSFLHRLNPTIKLVAFSLLTLAPTFYLDPEAPALFLALAIIMAWTLGGISPLTMARRMAPLWTMALALAISSTLFYGGARSHTLIALGPLTISAEALSFGLAMGLRILCVVSYSSLFVFTTDPTALVYSLIQQAHLSYRLGYTVLAAYRFVPILQREMSNISDAHSVRGAYSEHTPSAWLRRVVRYGVPLLANGIRQAERLAMAMDARGFASFPERTYYRRIPLRASDWLFLVASIAAMMALLLILARMGFLRGFMLGLSDSIYGGRQ